MSEDTRSAPRTAGPSAPLNVPDNTQSDPTKFFFLELPPEVSSTVNSSNRPHGYWDFETLQIRNAIYELLVIKDYAIVVCSPRRHRKKVLNRKSTSESFSALMCLKKQINTGGYSKFKICRSYFGWSERIPNRSYFWTVGIVSSCQRGILIAQIFWTIRIAVSNQGRKLTNA